MFFGALVASTQGAEVYQWSEASSSLVDHRPSVEESLVLIPYQSREQAREERRPKKKRCLTKVVCEEQGPM
ncbi:hypothetical protein ACLOJK_038406 [Asimina triloba]